MNPLPQSDTQRPSTLIELLAHNIIDYTIRSMHDGTVSSCSALFRSMKLRGLSIPLSNQLLVEYRKISLAYTYVQGFSDHPNFIMNPSLQKYTIRVKKLQEFEPYLVELLEKYL